MLIKFEFFKNLKKIQNNLILTLNYLLYNQQHKFLMFYLKFYFKSLKKKQKWFCWIKNKSVFTLNFLFFKRNFFFTFIKKFDNKLLINMSLKRLGFLGKARIQKISIITTILVLLKKIKMENKLYFSLLYSGLNKYKFILQKLLKTNFLFLKILYSKYLFKIPHNGTRLSLKKNRKKQKRRRNFFKKTFS